MSTTTPLPRPAASRARALLNKVPEVTIWFWIIKILCTTVGESFADWISVDLGVGLVNTSLHLHRRARRRARLADAAPAATTPFPYWLTVVVLSVTGTLYTDILTDKYHVSLAITTPVCRRAARRRVRRLVRQGAHAVDPQHRHAPPRGVLLARHPRHVRPRHRRRRLDPRAHRLVARRLGPAPHLPDRCRSSSAGGSAPTRCCRSGSPTSSPARSAPTSATGSRCPRPTAASTSAPPVTSVIFLAAILATVTYLAIKRPDVDRERDDRRATCRSATRTRTGDARLLRRRRRRRASPCSSSPTADRTATSPPRRRPRAVRPSNSSPRSRRPRTSPPPT